MGAVQLGPTGFQTIMTLLRVMLPAEYRKLAFSFPRAKPRRRRRRQPLVAPSFTCASRTSRMLVHACGP